MGGTHTVGRIARVAGATALGGAACCLAILAAEAFTARFRRYAKPDLRLAVRETVGRADRPILRLVMMGDATALGVGVERVTESVGGQLAELLSEGQSARLIELSIVAVAHSRSVDLATQVARALVGERPDVAVILVGARDIANLARPAVAAAHLNVAVRRLRRAGVATVVGTCPDLGAARAFPSPLRHVLSWYGRRLARHQAKVVRAAGGVPVDLGAQTGTVFRADPGTLCHDGFHPSADGYRVWAHALMPAVEDASRDRLVPGGSPD